MTREEEIENKAIEKSAEYRFEQLYSYNNDVYSGFIQGAQWADKNPKSSWISVEDDLPCNHKELISPDKSNENLTVTEYVVAVVYGFKLLSRMYELDGKWYWETDEPTHWFPIPKPPKK